MALNTSPSNDPVEFLHRKSGINKSRIDTVKVSDLLIIEDSDLDARALSALARSVFGHDIAVRHATAVLRAKNMLLERAPDLILLDDIIPPSDRAEGSIQHLRLAGYKGPIIVISGEMTRLRSMSIMKAGAAGVVHKDDLNASSLTEAVNGCAERAEEGGDDSSTTVSNQRGIIAHDDDIL